MSNNYLFPIATQASKDQSEINSLKNEIQQLKQQLEEAVEVIEFYGKNWRYVERGALPVFSISEDNEFDKYEDIYCFVGGKRARQFLAKYKGEK